MTLVSNQLETIIQNLDQNEKFDVITTDELKINKATGKKKKLVYGPILGKISINHCCFMEINFHHQQQWCEIHF